MKDYVIKKGQHSPSGLYFSPFLSKIRRMEKRVIFKDFAYDLGNANQLDWCKLFGISFGLLNNNHVNSIRVGCRYDVSAKLVELGSYVYQDGVRSFETLTSVYMGEAFLIGIGESLTDASKYQIYFSTPHAHGQSEAFGFNHNMRSGYRQFLWFGGDEPAPRDLIVSMEDI